MGCAAPAAYPLSPFRSRLARPFLLTALFLAAARLPFALWLTKNFMDGVPVALEEAPWTDGACWFQSLLRIVLPLTRPGLSVVAVHAFVMLWGNSFVPFMLLLSPEQLPASVSIFTFFGNYGTIAFGELAAFSILYSTPVLLLYFLVSRRLAGGFALGGAVKG